MDRKRNIIKILIVILCLLGVMLFALISAGVNVPFIEAYKINFKHNISGISNMLGIELPIEMQLYLDDTSAPTPKPTMIPASELDELEKALGYQTEEDGEAPPEGSAVLTTLAPVKPAKKSDQPTALDSASNAKFVVMGTDILCVNETRYRAFDKKGKLLWEIPIQMEDPQVTVKGEYVLINETGAKKIMLYKGKKEIFSATTEGNIITCDLSDAGDVAAVTEKEYFKGQVVVFNKNGKVIFAWDSGSYNILDAAISKDRNVAVSFLDTDVGADSFITCFGVDGKEKYKTETFSNTIIFDLEYCGKNLNAVSESRVLGISDKGKIAWEYDFTGKRLSNYQIAKNGSKMLLFESDGTGEIVCVSAGGRAYEPIKTESMPEVISIRSDRIAYNSGRDVVICSFKGKSIRRASCDSDIKGLHVLSGDEAFCVYSSSIQTKEAERVKKPEKVVSPETEVVE